MPNLPRITKSNATFQALLSLRDSRNRRFREGRFLVEGVKPLNRLLEHGWAFDTLLLNAGAQSAWARDYRLKARAPSAFEVAPELMAQLGGKEEAPEVLAVAKAPALEPEALPRAAQGVYVVADRPNSPGNLGSLVRSAEAFGAKAVLSYGHAADFFDPKAISASIGAVFALPLARLEGPEALKAWLAGFGGAGPRVAALDEHGTVDAWALGRDGVTVMVVGNETDGLGKVFRELCTDKVRIPMTGTATSLNAASSGSILLYELLIRPR